MKKALFAMAFAALFAVGCQMSDFAPDMKKDLKVFTGTIVDGGTRASLVADGDIYHVTWGLGDRIMINGEYPFDATVGDVTTTYFVQDTTGTLPDEPPTGPYTAVFPVNVSRGLPGVQNYVPNGIEFIPMMATSETENLAFKNLVGLLKLNIKTGDAGIVVKRVVITADQPMSGEFTVENNAAVVAEGNGVTLNCAEGVAIGADPIPFLVTVPANTYTGMTIKVYTTDGKVASVKMKSGASVTVERSKVYEAEFPFNSFTPIEGVGGVAILPSGPDFNATIKQIAMEDDLATNTTVDEECVTRIVFNTLSTETEGLQIQDLASDKPIYLVYDKASGVVSINSPAATLKTPEDASYMFATLEAMTNIDNLKCLDTEDAELMNHMFCQTGGSGRKLRELDLSSFNTSNATTMRSMFNGLREVKSLDVSTFDTQNVESMYCMFQYCTNITSIDLSNFNTENVSSMEKMFGYCTSLESVNLSSFNTENVLTFGYMFTDCESLVSADLSSFNTENATNIGRLFYNCYSLTDVKITNFSFASATEVRSFFYRCYSLQVIDVSMLDGTGITATANCGYFFYHDRSLREIYCGDTFIFGNRSSNFMCGKSSAYEDRPGSVFGSLTIYCDQDIADWFASTGLRWIAHGFNSAGLETPPIPIYFKHYKTGNELTVEWWDDNA